MSEGPPLIIIGIAITFIAITILASCNWNKIKQPITSNKKTFLPLFITGLVLALTAAYFMFDGDILGEKTTGVATVIGIVGIGLIATSNVTLLSFKRK